MRTVRRTGEALAHFTGGRSALNPGQNGLDAAADHGFRGLLGEEGVVLGIEHVGELF